MFTVAFTLNVTGDASADDVLSPLFPAGTVAGGMQCLLNGSTALPVTLPLGTLSGQFADVVEGEYTFEAYAIDSNGHQLGQPFSGPVLVKAPVVEPVPEPVVDPALTEVKIAVPNGFSYTVS